MRGWRGEKNPQPAGMEQGQGWNWDGVGTGMEQGQEWGWGGTGMEQGQGWNRDRDGTGMGLGWDRDGTGTGMEQGQGWDRNRDGAGTGTGMNRDRDGTVTEFPYGSLHFGHHNVLEKSLKNGTECPFSVLLFLPFYVFVIFRVDEIFGEEEFVVSL